MSPTARALQQLRREGWLASVTEKWNPGARVRQDLFGFIDILAIKADHHGCLGIQVTTTGHMADRYAKMTSEPVVGRLKIWLAAGNAVQILGWSKKGARGKRKVWTLTIREVVLLNDGPTLL